MPRGGSVSGYSFHSFEMVISLGFRDSHRRLCITLLTSHVFVLYLLISSGIATGLAMCRLGGCD